MFEIVAFYFGIIASLFIDLLQKFEIFPGIPYGTWLIGLFVFGSFLSIVFLAVKEENIRLAQLAVRKNREINISKKQYIGKHSSLGLAKHSKAYLERRR